MPRGVPLTPEQTETLARVYGETGNYSEAARAAGVDPSVARRALERRGESSRAQLHARACDRGLREARKQLGTVAAIVARVIGVETAASVSLEPKDLAALANTLARLTDTRLALALAADRRRTGRLTRDKLRAEIAALRRDPDAASGDIQFVVRVTGGHAPVDPDREAG